MNNITPCATHTQKVLHVESGAELLKLIKSDSQLAQADVIRLVEKANGFYAAIPLADLLEASTAIKLQQTPKKLCFAGRAKLSYIFEAAQLKNLNQVLEFLSYSLQDITIKAMNNQTAGAYANIIVLGELTVAGEHQNFPLTSSALRRKVITAQLDFLPFAMFNATRRNPLDGSYQNLIKWNSGMSFEQQAASPLGTLDLIMLEYSETTLRAVLRQRHWEGFVYYDSSSSFVPSKRTSRVAALKFPVFIPAQVTSFAYNYTTRGRIITQVTCCTAETVLSDGTTLPSKRVILGSGIDDLMRSKLEAGFRVDLLIKCEHVNRDGNLIKPVIASKTYIDETKASGQ
jgi:hypothetical protein